MVHDSAGNGDYVDLISDDDLLENDNSQSSPLSSPVHPMAETLVQSSPTDAMFATLDEMGFSFDMVDRAIKEAGPNADISVIIDTISKYSSNCEAGSSKSKAIDHLLGMGFDERKVIKAIREHGEENMERIANALCCEEEEKLPEVEEEDDIDLSLSDDERSYSDMSVSDDEKDLNSSPETENYKNKFKSLVAMGYSELYALLALERCGKSMSIAELADFILAAQIDQESDEFPDDPQEQKPSDHVIKKRRIESRREARSSTNEEPIRPPSLMIGFGLPNEPPFITDRSLPDIARGPPYFYFENVARTPRGVWNDFSRSLYGIAPEFVDSIHICAAARKRGYIHNLPISNRYQPLPLPKETVHGAFPGSSKWWPTWDERTKLNCILTNPGGRTKAADEIRIALEPYKGVEPPLHVQKHVIGKCKTWNLIWVGKNKAAGLELDEIENLMGFPINHTRGGGTSTTNRYKGLGNAFQVETVAYHLSVLKPMFPSGLNVLSLFTGIGGAEVALHRLRIPMKTVVSVEISQVSRNIFRDYWAQTNQKGVLIEFKDVKDLTRQKIEELMEHIGGFDIVIGGSPCNNLSGSNRRTRNGLQGGPSTLFFDYSRILKVVRAKAAKMRRS